MPLSLKYHFTFAQLADLWTIPLTDIHYLASHGIIEVQSRVELPLVGFPPNPVPGCENPKGAAVPGSSQYFVIKPDNVWRILRQDPGQLQIFPDDLVVSRAERERFELLHGLSLPGIVSDRQTASTGSASYLPSMSFGGRPSIVRQITDELKRRFEAGIMEDTLQRECEVLVAWAADNIPKAQIPTANSLRNALRSTYRQYRQPANASNP